MPSAHENRYLHIGLWVKLSRAQDASFVAASQTKMLSAVPWYRERLLGSISVGSLVVIILVRTVHTNLSKDHDAYVNTNCLAALANMAPHLRKLHPHAARCLLSTCDVFSRRFLKRSRGRSDDASAPNEDGGVGGDDGAESLAMFADYLRISLEVRFASPLRVRASTEQAQAVGRDTLRFPKRLVYLRDRLLARFR